MTDRDTAAALAKALPAGLTLDGSLIVQRTVAAFQAERLAEAGWVLVRPDDEATVRRAGTAIHDRACNGDTEAGCAWFEDGREECDLSTFDSFARAALAALAAPRPGTADTAHTEVEA